MKIAIIGTHGTGKTTLLNALSQLPEFREYKIISELPRKYLEENNLTIQEVNSNVELQSKFQKYCFREQLRQQAIAGDNYISDRSLFDVIAYSQASDFEEIQKMGDSFKSIIRLDEELSLYDLLIFCPIEWNMSQDDIDNNRMEDEIYRELINDLIHLQSLFYESEDKLITVTGSTEERVKTILSKINKSTENQPLLCI
jgi:predicted ATPase